MTDYQELNFEKILAIIFIFVSIMSIYGDSLEQKFIKSNNVNDEILAKKVFIIALIVSILIYLYFVYRNYQDLEKAIIKNQNISNSKIRFFGSILIIVGFLCILYYQTNTQSPEGSPPV